MLDPQGRPGQLPLPEDERPIGDLVGDLVDEGKALARAEIALVKAQARARVGAFKLPAALLGAALLLAQAAVTVLAVGLFVALTPALGPVGSALVVFAAFALLAGLAVYVAASRLKGDG